MERFDNAVSSILDQLAIPFGRPFAVMALGVPRGHRCVPFLCHDNRPSAIGQPPAAAKPPSTLTAHQQDRLNERDRLGKKVQELKSRGNLTEAIVAADAALALKREVLGETSDDAIGSIELIAQMHEELGNWAAAKKARADVLNLRTGTLGNDHWKVTDARWACTRADTLAKLNGAATRRLLKAARLEEQVATLYAQGQYVEAVGPAPGAGYPSGVVGQRDPEYASSLANLAVLLYEQGELVSARPLHERALALRKELLGKHTLTMPIA